MKRQFGRVFVPDGRDKDYPVPRSTVQRNHRYWRTPWIGDQKNTPQCVAYAWVGFCHDNPYPIKPPYPFLRPTKLYSLAKDRDEYEGRNYDGTSVRGGITAMLELIKPWNFTVEYRWAFTLEECIETVAEIGPMVVGTDVYSGFMETDSRGYVTNKGAYQGGHAYVLSGLNIAKGFFRIQNSWGRSWGKNGTAKISFDAFEDLLLANGEACIAIEKDS